MYKRWKQGQVRNAKANPELNLVRDMQGNKKGFYKYISSTRKTRKNVVPLLNEAGELMTNGMRKDEGLHASASVFTGKPSLQESQASQTRRKVCDPREDMPSEDEDQMRETLNKLDIQKSMGRDGLPRQVLKKPADVTVTRLSLKGCGSWKRFLKTVREQMTLIFTKSTEKDSENYRPVRFTSVPNKMREQIILKNISKLMKDKKMTGLASMDLQRGNHT